MTASKTKMLAIDAMLSAMCAALGYFSLEIGTLKFTFEAFPVFAAALLLGPLHGTAVGAIGTGIYQLLKYGLTVTTPLWILPYALAGLILGIYAKKKCFESDRKSLVIVLVLTELLITALNTGAIYVDSRIFGYYSKAYVFGSLAVRACLSAAKGVIFGAVMPAFLKSVRNYIVR